MKEIHIPVLTEEVKTLLNLKEGDTAIDATFGGGGHTKFLIQAVGATGKVLAIEQDLAMIDMFESHVPNLEIANRNFREIDEIARQHGIKKVDVILFDLGISRWHFLESGRGFSFQNPDEPLLMNLERGGEETAARIVGGSSEKELAEIFINYGEIKPWIARRFAKAIVEARKKQRIFTTGDLLWALGTTGRQGKIHPATQVFQALRIAVNQELENLKIALEKSFEILVPGGRMAVISFHSLEDRIVKNFNKEKNKNKMAEILTKKPITVSREERLNNPSSRSAKLRALKKI